MGLFDRYLYVRIVTAEPENILTKASASNIELQDVVFIDLLTIELKIRKFLLPDLEKILGKSGISYKVTKRSGVLWNFFRVGKRPILVIGIVLFLLFAGMIPNRVFFVQVTGNDHVPAKLILAQAENCGIRFGAKAAMIRSEKVKNQLLGSIPELQWVGITTTGSVAVIQVMERSGVDEQEKQENIVSSIVAVRDGVITQMTVEKGNPLFSIGQSVNTGDVLVSGYTDCGIKLKAEDAQAEIFAHTLRQNQFLSPIPSTVRGQIIKKQTCYKLHIGKKVINLCNHSGISDTTCVKMYLENYWTLPGGFRLPVSLIKVEQHFYEPANAVMDVRTSFQWLSQYAHSYLKTQMIAGNILVEDLQWDFLRDACVLTGRYACSEMIGQVRYEEIMGDNAEDN